MEETIFCLKKFAVFLLASTVANAEYPWIFDNDLFGGPDFWGLVNRQWRLCTIGQMQSPINIDPERLLFDPGLTKLSISNAQVESDFVNTGQLPFINMNQSTGHNSRHVNISGGPAFPYNYRLHSVAIHFGQANEKERGSEHTVDRVRFPAEVQLFAYNFDLYENYTEAMTQPRGLLAIGIVVDIGEITNAELRRLTVASQSITYKDSKTKLKRFHPSQLMPNTEQYVTYEGSLTFPGCYETVTWVILNNPIYINKEDLAIWNDLQQTSTKQSNPVFMAPNYRPLKPLNGRLIRTNINVRYKVIKHSTKKRYNTFYRVDHVVLARAISTWTWDIVLTHIATATSLTRRLHLQCPTRINTDVTRKSWT
jgi:carbonic anhydrase